MAATAFDFLHGHSCPGPLGESEHPLLEPSAGWQQHETSEESCFKDLFKACSVQQQSDCAVSVATINSDVIDIRHMITSH